MRTIGMMLVLAVAATVPAAAQAGAGGAGGQGGGGGRRSMMEAPKSGQGILTGITLNAEQQKKVDELWAKNEPQRQEQMEKMQKMRESGTRPDSATMAANRAARQAQVNQYRAILTPDQQKVFDENVAKMRERMGGPGGPGGPPPARQ